METSNGVDQNQEKQNSPVVTPPPAAPAQPYYVGTMPAEAPVKSPGKTEGVIAIICACVALLFVPPLFGIIGILLGVKSKQKGQTTLATVAIVLSSVFMVLGIVLGILTRIYLPAAKAAVGI